MSTPPFLTFPDNCPATITMTLSRVVGITRSPFTLEEQRFAWPGSQWSVQMNMPPIKGRGNAADLIAFAAGLEGSYGQFLLGDPGAKVPRGALSGPALVNGGGQTGNTLIVDGLTPNTIGAFKKADYFQVGSGTNSRLHMLTEDIDTDASGQATLIFEPALRYSPNDDVQVIFTDPKGLFRMTENSFSWSQEPGQIYRMAFSAIEVPNA